METKKRVALVACVALVALAGCSKDSSKADLDQPKIKGDIVPKDFETVSPDSVRVYANVDSHPTIIRLCLDGLAFRTVSDKYADLATPAVERIPEWDATCRAVQQ